MTSHATATSERQHPRQRTGRSIVALLVVALLAGCGDDAPPSADRAPTATSTTAAKAAPTSGYRSQVARCLQGVGYTTRDAGNALRVESAGGKRIANVQTFATAKAAAAFANQLEVPGASDGKGVAVFFATSDDSARRVVADCLTP